MSLSHFIRIAAVYPIEVDDGDGEDEGEDEDDVLDRSRLLVLPGWGPTLS